MIANNHIDVGGVLRRRVCHLYMDLVTRPTGAAVRSEIEHQLGELQGRTLTVIDLSQVGLLDFSCADEVIAKLLLRYQTTALDGGIDGYFVVRGVNECHLDAIEAVLERHRLALLVETVEGELQLVGALPEHGAQAWAALCAAGRAGAATVGHTLGIPADEAERLLGDLCRLRVVIPVERDFVAVNVAAALALPRLQ